MNKAKRLINTLSARLAAMSLAAAALLATATGLGCLSSRTGGAPRGYSVAVLGDVHYDAPPVERFHSPGRPGHFKCNVLMWEKDMPAMLAASASRVGRAAIRVGRLECDEMPWAETLAVTGVMERVLHDAGCARFQS